MLRTKGDSGVSSRSAGRVCTPQSAMTRSDERASAGSCDANARCLRAPCFQVQLDVARPRQAHRQANACAYHVPEVIQALRAWAGEHGVADGQLTVLAIEPAAGGRPPGFAFSRIPLTARD